MSQADGPQSIVRVIGHVHIATGRRNPITGEFEVLSEQLETNGTTDTGDSAYASRICGVAPGGGGVPIAVTGMRLGTGTTAFAKSGTGSTLASYLTNSALKLDTSGGITNTLSAGAGCQIAYTTTWPAGTCNNAGISEVVLTNQALSSGALPMGAGSSGDTLARVVLSPVIDTTVGGGVDLIVTWFHTILGPSS